MSSQVEHKISAGDRVRMSSLCFTLVSTALLARTANKTWYTKDEPMTESASRLSLCLNHITSYTRGQRTRDKKDE